MTIFQKMMSGADKEGAALFHSTVNAVAASLGVDPDSTTGKEKIEVAKREFIKLENHMVEERLKRCPGSDRALLHYEFCARFEAAINELSASINAQRN